jgi:hypothetical protein
VSSVDNSRRGQKDCGDIDLDSAPVALPPSANQIHYCWIWLVVGLTRRCPVNDLWTLGIMVKRDMGLGSVWRNGTSGIYNMLYEGSCQKILCVG